MGSPRLDDSVARGFGSVAPVAVAEGPFGQAADVLAFPCVDPERRAHDNEGPMAIWAAFDPSLPESVVVVMVGGSTHSGQRS